MELDPWQWEESPNHWISREFSFLYILKKKREREKRFRDYHLRCWVSVLNHDGWWERHERCWRKRPSCNCFDAEATQLPSSSAGWFIRSLRYSFSYRLLSVCHVLRSRLVPGTQSHRPPSSLPTGPESRRQTHWVSWVRCLSPDLQILSLAFLLSWLSIHSYRSLPCHTMTSLLELTKSWFKIKFILWEFPGCPVVRRFHCRGPKFNPWSGN